MRPYVIACIFMASLLAGCFFYLKPGGAKLGAGQGNEEVAIAGKAGGSAAPMTLESNRAELNRDENSQRGIRPLVRQSVGIEGIASREGISFSTSMAVLSSASFYDEIERFRVNSSSASSTILTGDYRKYVEGMLAERRVEARVKQFVCDEKLCVGSFAVSGKGKASREGVRNAILNSSTQGIYGFVDNAIDDGFGAEYRFIFSNNPEMAKITVGK